MQHSYKHTICVIIIAAYLCIAITPAITRTISRSLLAYTLIFKNKGENSCPITKSNPVKMHRWFVKVKEGFSYSPVFSEKQNTELKISNSYTIHSSNSESTCLFLLYTSLTDRAPPVL